MKTLTLLVPVYKENHHGTIVQ